MDEELPIVEPQPDLDPMLLEERPAKTSWLRRFSSIVFVIFCFEIGLFLLIYPWTDAWTENTISVLGRGEFLVPLRELWNNNYLRGTVSGFGVLNLWIAFIELFALFRRQS